MSIFKETFKDFVFRQLRIREAIVQTGNDGSTRFGNPRSEIQVGSNTENIAIAKGAFYTNSVSKQCVVRMTSGVNTSKFETEMNLNGDGIARNFILEGGILQENNKPKEGFAKENGAYGDKITRSDSADGFGIVPMPGIIDANIRTKTAYGSLREAQVNFVCHNRRQLDILEILYMRPGMPILLEWQWSPYINKEGNIEKNTKNIDFFDTSKSINELNLEIIKNKEDSDGNYDGFIGFCKNFEIVSRPDGGYDCVTELIAIGEVLEGLKTRNDGFSKTEENEVIPLDNMQVILEGALELKEIYSRRNNLQNIQLNNKNASSLALQIIKNDIKLTNEALKFVPGAKRVKDPTYEKNQQALTNYFESIKNFYLFEGETIGAFNVFNPFDYIGVTSNTTNPYTSGDTFIRWDYFCDKMNDYVFPLYDPSDTKKTLLRWSYTKPKNGKYDEVVDANRELENEEYIELVRYKIPKSNISKVDNKDGKILNVESVKRGTYVSAVHTDIDVENILNNSFNPKICLLPKQTNKNKIRKNIANSYYFFEADSDYIGHIMFNVEYLLKTYNKMAYSKDKPNENFNLFDFFKKIWNDVNEACLGHHNFILNVENERPDRIRIIDLQADPPPLTSEDIEKGKLYEFKIQSNESIVRDFNFNTTIPNSLSATIAVAAQAPTSINDLDQVTFANFTKDIKSRFTTTDELSTQTATEGNNEKIKAYTEDLERYKENVAKLHYNIARIQNGAFYNNGNVDEKFFSETRGLAKSIDKLITSILGRNTDGTRKKVIPTELSAVIPLKFNVIMDGISGIVIGNVFKVEKDKLPLGYQGDDVGFVVMGESQTITSGQDWTTELSGHLILLNLEEIQ